MEYVIVGVILAIILAAIVPTDDDGFRSSNNGVGFEGNYDD